MRRPRVLLSVGVYNWSFHHIASQLARRLADRFDVSVRVLREVQAFDEYDLAVSFQWVQSEQLRAVVGSRPKHIACLFDHASWSRDTGRKLFERCVRNCGIVAGSPMLAEVAREFGAARTWVCQDGVDLELFRPLPLPETFTVGWCGNVCIGDGTYKGLGLIQEACARLGLPLVTQTYEQKIPQAEMPERFYSRISAYVCASIAEGTPNPVFEALACGRPVVSTRVGLVDQVLRPGVNGVFVDRTDDAIAAALAQVRAWSPRPVACRTAVEPHGWDVAAARWGDAFDMALDGGMVAVQ